MCIRALLKSLDEKVCFLIKIRWQNREEEPTIGTPEKNSVANFNSRVLNAILNDVSKEKIRRISTVVVATSN